ncbi:SGNH/GDSL hydrolase family protein [Jeotgalibacillus sp. S-D1]|uniref:SGNH/GDSL hydrolase family protein n=1 Tax=Jeotgalibacillus sp. S-D1 TaxID=2552189 RepID=UPI00105A4ABF|nr:SGNH/GDSL hydrolase family protein [Jeotgalibacillus sp. S-D1]TDL33070.1 SGNH/GDSL hydrolase family protein [Jeotgalibacillus sp. S-D1]
MKKMISLLIAASVLLLLLGMVRGEYRHKQIEIEQKLERLNPALNNDINYFDYLTYRVMKNGSARVATLGSSVTKGVGASAPSQSWRALLQKELRDTSRPLKHVTVSNHGHSGYTSAMLLDQDVLSKVKNSRPDLIILETSVINNYRRSVSMEETQASIEELYRTFKEQIPGVEILFIAPNPILKENIDPSGLNQLGHTFEEYVDFTEQIIKDNKWNYFDTHGHMMDEMAIRGLEKKDVLNDMIHPNDLGYSIWFEELFYEGLTRSISGK